MSNVKTRGSAAGFWNLPDELLSYLIAVSANASWMDLGFVGAKNPCQAREYSHADPVTCQQSDSKARIVGK